MRHFPSGQIVGRLLFGVVPALTLPLMAGLLLDWRLGASPLWTAIGVCAGSLVGAMLVYRRMVRVLDTYLPTASDEDEAEANE